MSAGADRHEAAPLELEHPLERVRTGSHQADAVLGGGFPVNSINLVMGQPGTGKTLFAQQMVFHNAGGDRPILYLTTLSEPLAKVVKYLQGFSFFDADRLGTDIVYDELGGVLAADGIGALVPTVKEFIKQHSPKIIVIDSFKALNDIAPSMAEMRAVVHDLAGLLTAYDTTAFLVGEYSEHQIATLPEFVVADGIVELLRVDSGMRDDRYFRVRKLRGSHYSEGMHSMKLTPSGTHIYQRLVSPRIPPDYRAVRERVSTGVAGLDKVLHGGLWRGSTTFLAGPTGAGKTTIGLQFVLQGVTEGEACLYIHLEENPTQLGHLVRDHGGDPESPLLHTRYFSPVELQIDSLLEDMFELIRTGGVHRVVIDAIGDLVTAASDPQRLHDYLYSLAQHFAVSGVTAMLTVETIRPQLTGEWGLKAPFSHLSDNIILLEVEMAEDITRRKLRIIKTRGSGHDLHVREVVISGDGVEIR